MERTGIITFKGGPLTLVGEEVKVGVAAPNFTVLKNDLSPVSLSDFAGKTVIISAVPSLDTPVCDVETRNFNKIAAELGENVVVLTISMDLPFAQARWCGAAGIDKVVTASDHKEASFASAFGVMIKELRLLARSVFVVDGKGVLRYAQLVKEVTEEPNYEEVINAVKGIV